MENVCKKSFFIIILLLSQSILSIHAQTKIVDGIAYPKTFKINDKQNLNELNKLSVDTLTYKSFTKTTQDFNVINGCGNYDADQGMADIARSNDGSYLCVWEDFRTGSIEIDAQLFNKNDERVGDVIKVSDNYNYWNSEPNVVYNKISNNYIVLWAGSGFNIIVQQILSSGLKIGTNINVSQYSDPNQNNPSAAVDQKGNILITWYSQNDYTYYTKVICRVFDKNLNALTDQRQISTQPYDFVSSIGYDIRAAADSEGNIIVTWSAHYKNQSTIILQQLNSNGESVEEMLL